MIDILAIAPHPDDAEIFCGGLLAKAALAGKKTAIIDLTRGELSSNGDIETRAAEAEKASIALKLSTRINLGLPDGALNATGGIASEQIATLVDAFRSLKPQLVLIPFLGEGRHPDHKSAGELATQAAFFATLKKFKANKNLAPHTIGMLLQYQMRFSFKPSFVIDVTACYDIKRIAISCYHSQVQQKNNSSATLINAPLSLSSIEARDKYYGAMIGTGYGEAYYSESMLSIEDPLAIINSNSSFLFPGE